MKILGKQPSREKCAESGLVRNGLPSGCAYRQSFYIKSETSGKFCVSGYAERAFFKIENDYYMIKGVQGKRLFQNCSSWET